MRKRLSTGVIVLLSGLLLGCSRMGVNEPPLALFIVSTGEASVGEEVVFDASLSSDPDGTIVRYLWDFGDGTEAEAVVVTHTYREAGTYVVVLAIEDNEGATARAEQEIRVREGARPLVAAFTVSADVVAPFEDVTFDASSSYCLDAEILEYLWDFGDGGEDEGKVVVYSYFDLGVYIVTLTVRDSLGRTATAKKVIQVVAPPEEELTVVCFYVWPAWATWEAPFASGEHRSQDSYRALGRF